MLEAVSAVGGAIRVEQQGEGRAGFFQLGLSPTRRAERNHNDLSIQRFYFGGVLAQLRHVLAAGQSAKVPEEDKQGGMPTTPGSRQRNGLPIHCAQYQIRGRVASA